MERRKFKILLLSGIGIFFFSNFCFSQAQLENLSLKDSENVRIFRLWDNLFQVSSSDSLAEFGLVANFCSVKKHPNRKNCFLVSSPIFGQDTLRVFSKGHLVLASEFKVKGIPELETYIKSISNNLKQVHSFTSGELSKAEIKVHSNDYILPQDIKILSYNIDLYSDQGAYQCSLRINGAELTDHALSLFFPGEKIIFNEIIATYGENRLVQLPPLEISIIE